MEHYRPKKKVTGNQRNNHGYYWLCYEWTNLLPSCRACNTGNGKMNKFPVVGTRITAPPLLSPNKLDFMKCRADNAYLQSEVPLLLHPEIDEPSQFFKLEWNGKLTAMDGSEGKGQASIDTYDLNRGNLIKARKEIIDNFKEGVLLLFNGFRQGFIDAEILQEFLKIYLENFKLKSVITTPYSFVILFICQHYQIFLVDNFPNLSTIETQLLIESFPVEI